MIARASELVPTVFSWAGPWEMRVGALLLLPSPRAVVAVGDGRESPGPSGAEVLRFFSVMFARGCPRCKAAAGCSEGGSPRSPVGASGVLLLVPVLLSCLSASAAAWLPATPKPGAQGACQGVVGRMEVRRFFIVSAPNRSGGGLRRLSQRLCEDVISRPPSASIMRGLRRMSRLNLPNAG